MTFDQLNVLLNRVREKSKLLEEMAKCAVYLDNSRFWELNRKFDELTTIQKAEDLANAPDNKL